MAAVMIYHITYSKGGQIHTGRVGITRDFTKSASEQRRIATREAAWRFGVSQKAIISVVCGRR